MIRSTLATLTIFALSASTYASPTQVPLGNITAPMGSPLGMPALAIIGAVGLIAGIRYLRNKRS